MKTIDKIQLERDFRLDRVNLFRKWYYCTKINPKATERDWTAWKNGMLKLYDNL